AKLIAYSVGFTGNIVPDASQPEGTPRKLLDISMLESLGWHPSIGLEEGLASTYAWFASRTASERGVRRVRA
ncbi:MAG: GDP-L-fucose synthase, partial [Methyloceanibacter sp.]